MSKNLNDIEDLVGELDADEMQTLAYLVGGLDRLAMEDGEPKYTRQEIDLIGRFADLVEADDDDDESDNVENDDDTPEMAGYSADPGILDEVNLTRNFESGVNHPLHDEPRG